MIRGIVIGVLAATCVTNDMPAQQAVAATVHGVEASPLMRKVSAEFTNVTVRDAIDQLAERSGVRIQYRASVVDGVQRRVTMSVKDMPMGTILERVFHGTPLRVTPVGADFLTVVAADDVAVSVQGAIVGKVIHARTKQPIAGATVRVGDDSKGIVTGTDGSFRIPISAGEHVIHVRNVGFVRYTQKVTVPADQTVSLEIVMEPSASVLDEVIVTGTVVATERKAIPTPITVITAEDIERRGITRVEELFRGDIPGVIALDQGANVYFAGLGSNVSSRVYARGSSTVDVASGTWGVGASSPLKTYVDGVELLDANNLGTIDPQSIERIEIITGPQASTIYGSNAMGGVMQIFTKKGVGKSTPDIVLQARYGTLQSNMSRSFTPTHTQQLNLSGAMTAGLTYAGNFSHRYSGQWQPGLFSRQFGGQIGATHRAAAYTVTASTSVSKVMNGTAKSSGRFGMGPIQMGSFVDLVLLNKMQTGEWGIVRPSNHLSPQKSTTSSWLASLSMDFVPVQSWQHHLTIGRNQNNMQLLPYAPAFASYTDTLYGTQVRTGERTTFDYNTTWLSQWESVITSNLTVGGNGSSGSQVFINGCLANNTASAYIGCTSSGSISAGKPVSVASGGGFASWRIGVYDRLFLTLGARAERNNNYGKDYGWDVTPTQGIAYTVDVGDVSIKLLGAYGRTTRPPNPDYRNEARSLLPAYDPESVISQLAAPTIGPEYTRGPSGGIEVYVGQRGMLSLNHYRQTVTDLLQNVVVDTVVRQLKGGTSTTSTWVRQYQNVADLLQQGWDATASIRMWKLDVKGTYSWNTNKVTKTKSNYSVPDLPSHFGNIGLGYAHQAVSVNVDMSYVGGSTTHWAQNHIFYLDNFLSRLPVYVDRSALGGGSAAGPWKPGYWRGNMTAFYRVSRTVSATLNMKNVTSNYNTEVNDLVPALGRQTQVGFSIRLP